MFVIEKFMEVGPKYGVTVRTADDLLLLKEAFESHSLFASAEKCMSWYNYFKDRIEGEYNVATNAEAE